MVRSSYWLSEERPGFPDRASRPAGPIEVAIVGGGVTGCACALALAEAGRRRPRLRGSRGRGGCERTQRRLRAARRRAGLRRCPPQPGAGAGQRALAHDGALSRSARSAGRRRLSAHGQPPPRGGSRGAVRARSRVRGSPRGRLRGRVARGARGAAPRPVRRGDFPSTGWVASACPLGTPARGACGRGGRGAARARARGVARRARGRPGRGRHRRLHARPPGAARRDRQAYAGPGARDRASRAGACSRARITPGTATTTGSRRRRDGLSPGASGTKRPTTSTPPRRR